jgi:Rps23 Pro-64 3,4-dihydroxylase Tpa1-like proline 4-hydroxylase
LKRLEAGQSNHESLSWLFRESWQWNGVSVGMAALQFGVECFLYVHGDNHRRNNQSKAFVVKYCNPPDWKSFVPVSQGFVTFAFAQ